MTEDACRIMAVDAERVEGARQNLPPEHHLHRLAETFRVLGEPTRVRILAALTEAELCVCDLAALAEASVSAVSHQLRLLRAAGLVRFRKAGKMVYYTLDDDHIRALLAEGLRHVEERG